MPIKEIETFGVSYLQILDETGKVDTSLEPALDDAELIRLYRGMMHAREGDQRMLKLQRQGRIGTFGPCTGQEASVCGPTLAMTDRDWFVGAFRELGGRLMRGDSFTDYLLFHNGYEEGSTLAAERRTLPFSIIVGSQCLHAAGLGYAMKYKGEKDAAVVTFFGDGATSEGDFHEAMNFAAVWQAPVVFVCQNNQWAISIPRENQTRSETLAQKAIAYGMPGVQVDGNDALATYAATREALDRAYSGGGPTLIEAVTYRMMMHTTADDPTKYRSDDEVDGWRARDPLTRFRTYLEGKGIWNDDLQAGLETELKAEINAAVEAFEARTEFKPDVAFDYVYGTSHPEIDRQRAEFLDELKKEKPNG